MQINQLRGLLYEFGVSFKAGRKVGLAEIRQRIDEVEQAVPGMLFDALREQLQHIGYLDSEISKLEKRLSTCSGRTRLAEPWSKFRVLGH